MLPDLRISDPRSISDMNFLKTVPWRFEPGPHNSHLVGVLKNALSGLRRKKTMATQPNQTLVDTYRALRKRHLAILIEKIADQKKPRLETAVEAPAVIASSVASTSKAVLTSAAKPPVPIVPISFCDLACQRQNKITTLGVAGHKLINIGTSILGFNAFSTRPHGTLTSPLEQCHFGRPQFDDSKAARSLLFIRMFSTDLILKIEEFTAVARRAGIDTGKSIEEIEEKRMRNLKTYSASIIHNNRREAEISLRISDGDKLLAAEKLDALTFFEALVHKSVRNWRQVFKEGPRVPVPL
jgi:hypothetical protein